MLWEANAERLQPNHEIVRSFGRATAARVSLFAGGLLTVVGVFLSARLIAGAMSGRAPGFQLVAIGLVLGATIRILDWFASRRQESRLAPWKSNLLAYLGCGLIAVTASLSSATWIGTSLVWVMMAVPAAATGLIRSFNRSRNKVMDEADRFRHASYESPRELLRFENSPKPASDLEGCDLDPPVDQMIIRRVAPDGGCEVVAKIRARFEKGERTKNLHLGFCPPLENLPELTVEQSEGPEAEIFIGQRLHAGVRVDVRLRQTAVCEVSVVVDLFATSSS